ncbi:TolC family outer membrane protein [Pelagibius marinus]|uniref:TolC family outer membrane protein n=1 Tax=Pelagibius marinus TaxID=2762760 RepID=UPI0018723E4F|nr:TolC family outer membrane protein [Pelagibius marinus]
MTLQEAVQQAIATNPDIGIVASNREAVDQELRQARGLYLPQIDVAAGIGIENFNDSTSRANNNGGTETTNRRESSITLQQRLFDGFEAGATVEREMARVESAANRVLENSEVLALDAIGAYVEVLRQRDLVRLAEDNVAYHQQVLDAQRARLQGGGGSQADVDQTEARYSRAKNTLVTTLQDLRVAEAVYTRIVGSFPGNDLSYPEFPAASLPADLDEAVQLAVRNNPTTKIFEADVRTAEAEIELAEVPLYPAVTLEAQSEYNDGTSALDTYEFNNQLMVRVRWNIFRGGIDRAARQEALFRLTESKNRRYRSVLESQQEMRRSWFELEAARDSIEALEDARDFNRSTLGAYEQQFEVAQRTLLDVLDAENELFTSEGQLITAQTNEQLASYRILGVGGVLLETLGVSAPEQAVVEHKSWIDGLAD